MGFTKYTEDLKDTFDDQNKSGYSEITLPETEPSPKCISCIYSECNLQFSSKDKLNNHLLHSHNISFYIKIDDILADEKTELFSIPDNILIVNNSPTDALDVEINYNHIDYSSFTLNKNCSYPLIIKKEGIYDIGIKQVHKKYIIQIKSELPIDEKAINIIVEKYLEEIFILFKTSHDSYAWDKYWGNFISAIQNQANSNDKRYLSGIYHFLYARYLEEQNIDGIKEHYEKAFGILRFFNIPTSVLFVQTIAFRMNYFSLLLNVSKSSLFYPVNVFFNFKYDKIHTKALGKNYGSITESILSDNLITDTSNTLLIRAVHAFMGGKIESCKIIVDKLSVNMQESVLFTIKLLLLKARINRFIGNKTVSQKYYRLLNELLDENNILITEFKEYKHG